MNSSRFLSKLVARKQQCCRAFSITSGRNAQQNNAAAALASLITESKPAQTSAKQTTSTRPNSIPKRAVTDLFRMAESQIAESQRAEDDASAIDKLKRQ